MAFGANHVMAGQRTTDFLGHLRKLLAAQGSEPARDSDLLQRYVTCRDEDAFLLLVQRHGPLVLGVCQGMLRHRQDAEDAFQATFLVLARKAHAVRKREALASWLYGVAHRVACKALARRGAAGTGTREVAEPSTVLDDLTWRELNAVLHEELRRLPPKYQAPLLLCYWQGRTYDEAAAQLGWTKGLLKDRLERARGLLRGRLTRRGVSLTAALPATLLAPEAGAALSPLLMRPAVEAALQVAAGQGVTGGAVSARAAALAEEVLPALGVSRIRVVALLLALVLLGVGGVLAYHARTDPAGGGQDANRGPAAQDEPLPAAALLRLGTNRFRHSGFVASIAFSPDGKLIATGDGYRLVRLWDAATGRLVRTLNAHIFERVYSLAFSPDGKLLASGGGDWTARIWDVATGKQLHVLGKPTVGEGDASAFGVYGVAFSPDGKTLLTTSPEIHDRECALRLWDVATGKELRRFGGHENWVRGVALSSDGKTAVSYSFDRTARLWDVATGKEPRQLKIPGEILAVTFSPDARILAQATHEGPVHLWDLTSGKELHRLPGVPEGYQSVASSPDGKTLALGSKDGPVHLYEVATGKERLRLEGHLGSVHSLRFSPDGKTLASGTWDHVLALWDLATGKPRFSFEGHQGEVLSVAFAPDGKTLVTRGQDNTVRLWDLATGKERVQLVGGQGVTKGGRKLDGHDGWIFDVALSPDGKQLVTAGLDKTVRLWDAATGKQVRVLGGHSQDVRSVSFAPDGKTVASLGGHGDDTVRLWDVAAGKERAKYKLGPPGYFYQLSHSPDGKTLAVWGQPKCLFWDPETGKDRHPPLVPGKNEFLTLGPFSPDGKFIASIRGAETIQLWDVAKGAYGTRFVGHKDWVRAVAFSPDGKRLASGGSDHTVRLWDVATGEDLVRVNAGHGRVKAVAFSPDGRRLASAGEDTTVLIWDVARLLGEKK